MNERSGPSFLQPPQTVSDLVEILDAISHHVTVWDEDRRLLFANLAVRDWLGRTMPDLLGVSIGEIVGGDLAEPSNRSSAMPVRTGSSATTASCPAWAGRNTP